MSQSPEGSTGKVPVDGAGDFLVIWQSSQAAGDPSSYSVHGRRFLTTADLTGRVFFDTKGDWLQGPPTDEQGVADVIVSLHDASTPTLLSSTTTDGSGAYRFRPQIALDGQMSRFFLRFEAPPERLWTSAGTGDEALDSDVDPATGETPL